MDFHRSFCYWKAAKLARIFRIAKCSLSYLGYDIYDIYVSFLDWVGIVHFGIIFSFLSFTFLAPQFIVSVPFFFWNSVRIWSWMIHYGLIHQCLGTGSCLVVKKVTMSEKVQMKYNQPGDRLRYFLSLGAPDQTTDLHNICGQQTLFLVPPYHDKPFIDSDWPLLNSITRPHAPLASISENLRKIIFNQEIKFGQLICFRCNSQRMINILRPGFSVFVFVFSFSCIYLIEPPQFMV